MSKANNQGWKPAHLHCHLEHCSGSTLINNTWTCTCCGSPEECRTRGTFPNPSTIASIEAWRQRLGR